MGGQTVTRVSEDKLQEARRQWKQCHFALCGTTLTSALTPEEKVWWSRQIVDYTRNILDVPAYIQTLADDVVGLQENQALWKNGRLVFDRIRALTLEHYAPSPLSKFLSILELTAKTMYNASGLPGPFDSTATAQIVVRLAELVTFLNTDNALEICWTFLRSINSRVCS